MPKSQKQITQKVNRNLEMSKEWGAPRAKRTGHAVVLEDPPFLIFCAVLAARYPTKLSPRYLVPLSSFNLLISSFIYFSSRISYFNIVEIVAFMRLLIFERYLFEPLILRDNYLLESVFESQASATLAAHLASTQGGCGGYGQNGSRVRLR